MWLNETEAGQESLKRHQIVPDHVTHVIWQQEVLLFRNFRVFITGIWLR